MITDDDRRYRTLMLTATGLWAVYVLLVLAVDAFLRHPVDASTPSPPRPVTIHATR